MKEGKYEGTLAGRRTERHEGRQTARQEGRQTAKQMNTQADSV